ncbi:MAG: methyltransferase domain-containing protein [Bacteroidota bacterium]
MDHYLSTRFNLDDPDLISAIDDLPLWSAPFGLKLLEVVELRQNMRVLDVGSGTGFPLLELSQRLGSTSRVFGIDPWTTALDRVRMKIRLWGAKNVQLVEGVAEAMPFEDGYFDLVVSNNGINNVEDDRKTLSEISRVSRPGAQLVVTVNLPDTMVEFYDIYRAVLHEAGKSAERERLEEHIWKKRKPLAHTRGIIEEAGFAVKETHRDQFALRYTDGRAMLENHIVKLAFLDSWKEILDEGDRDPVFRRLEDELNHLARRVGEVRLTIPWVCLDCRKAQ